MTNSGDTQTNGTNGYARIREVYDLLRDSEDRSEKRMIILLDALERRLTERIEDNHSETRDFLNKKEEERQQYRTEMFAAWDKHLADFNEVRSRLESQDVQEYYEQAYSTGRREGVMQPAKAILHFWDFLEQHWRTLAVVLLALSLLLNIDLLSTLLGR